MFSNIFLVKNKTKKQIGIFIGIWPENNIFLHIILKCQPSIDILSLQRTHGSLDTIYNRSLDKIERFSFRKNPKFQILGWWRLLPALVYRFSPDSGAYADK